jgi:hypothetical protein
VKTIAQSFHPRPARWQKRWFRRRAGGGVG